MEDSTVRKSVPCRGLTCQTIQEATRNPREEVGREGTWSGERVPLGRSKSKAEGTEETGVVHQIVIGNEDLGA